MGGPTDQRTRCARCSAALRPGAPWCTQCYAATEDAAADATADATAAATAGVTADGLSQPAQQTPSVAAWPCGACGHASALADDVCAACGTPFLAAVREAEPSLVLPVVGDLAAMPPARRVTLAVAVVVAFLATTALLGLLLA